MIDQNLVFDGTPTPGVVPGFTGVAVTVSRQSTNIVDLLVARDIAQGNAMTVHVATQTAFAGGTSLSVGFQGCATSGGAYQTLMQTPAIPVADLIANQALFRDSGLPLNQVPNVNGSFLLNSPFRYIAMYYTVVGTMTQGTVIAYLGPALDRQAYTTYPNNYTV